MSANGCACVFIVCIKMPINSLHSIEFTWNYYLHCFIVYHSFIQDCVVLCYIWYLCLRLIWLIWMDTIIRCVYIVHKSNALITHLSQNSEPNPGKTMVKVPFCWEFWISNGCKISVRELHVVLRKPKNIWTVEKVYFYG